MIENIKEISEQMYHECVEAINEDINDREFNQLLNKADKTPIPITRYETIIEMAKKVSKYDVEKALYAIRRQPACLYAQSQAEIAYQVAKNGDIKLAKILANSIIDIQWHEMTLENINDIKTIDQK